MKVLLCLLSDQHVPNLLSVHHFQPDRLVLVESIWMHGKKTADHFLSALRAGGLNYDDRTDVLALNNVNAPEITRRCLRQAYGKYSNADWVANVTGGMKPMSIAAYEFFKALDARLVYIDWTRPDEMLSLDGRLAEKCGHRLSIAEFLAGYGFESSKSDKKIADAEERADKWWECARTIAEFSPGDNLLSADREEWAQARNKGLELQPHHLGNLKDLVKDAVQKCFGLESNGESLVGSVDKYVGKFLTGEWLEVFFWGLLRRHAAATDIDHVHLGVEARKVGTDAVTDFDVAFMRGHALGAIECKSGGQEHGDDPNIPLDKLEARIQQFRALRVNPILATTVTKILDESGGLKAHFAARASVYSCRIINDSPNPGSRSQSRCSRASRQDPVRRRTEAGVVRMRADIIFYSIGVGRPITSDEPLPPLPDVPRGALVVVEGRAPIWRYGMALHQLHGSPAGAVAFYDPRLGAVVVASHSSNWIEGQVIDVTPPAEDVQMP